jgi:hypothetical protein
MSFKGVLTTGDRYSITIASDPGTPGTTAASIVWVPNVGSPAITPTVHAVPPGMASMDAGIVPAAQMLLIDLDLPDVTGAKVTATVTSGPIGGPPRTVAGSETADNDWTFLVQP